MIRGQGTLEERQKEMRSRKKEAEAPKVVVQTSVEKLPRCITGCGRQARRGSDYCSRCSATKMVENLRDRLPGLPTDVIEQRVDEQEIEDVQEPTPDNRDASDPGNSIPPNVHGTRYTRAQIAEIVGVSCTTLNRWEKKGRTPQPIRTTHNNQVLYTEEMLKAIIEYKNAEYVPPPVASIPGTPEAMSPRTVNKSVKINKRMERAVARSISSIGRRMI
jgi:transcriptional regulator with XRE-family HTH domain